jgi:hypothetical protein
MSESSKSGCGTPTDRRSFPSPGRIRIHAALYIRGVKRIDIHPEFHSLLQPTAKCNISRPFRKNIGMVSSIGEAKL